jgi:DNA-binding winged helix-turn-helix (wHTH) protein
MELRPRRKPFAILKHCARAPRRLITHDEIVQAVGGKVVMSESRVRTHVRDLRQSVGEDPIETVVGRGYRFLADVTTVDHEIRVTAANDAAQVNGSIIGRSAELDLLETALKGVRERERTIAFVTGEPGVGKTALVDAFIERARAQAAPWVARGACVEQ